MKILKILTLRGSNQWHIQQQQLIVVRLELEAAESSEFERLVTEVKAVMPSLNNLFREAPSREAPSREAPSREAPSREAPSREAPSREAPSREASNKETSSKETPIKDLPSLVRYVALELQTLAGMQVGFATGKPTAEPNVHQVVFEYQFEQAGRYAARAAVRLCQSVFEQNTYPQVELEQDIADLKELRLEAQLGPSTESIVAEANAKRIPWLEVGSRAMIQMGYGIYQRRIQATLSSMTNVLSVELACDKEGTKKTLRSSGVPVPKGTVIKSPKYLQEAIAEVGGFPIVIKPLNGNHGRGITIDIQSMLAAADAFEMAAEVSEDVIIERFHKGRDHRVLVINGKVVAVAERIPAHVIGDSRSSITELIEITNRDPRRGDGHDNVLTKIVIDRTSLDVLQRQGYTLDSIPKLGAVCYLRATANLSTGGVAVDRTDDIHLENIWLAQRVAKIIGLDIAGIDIVTLDISKPLREVDGVIVEVNAAPGFRMHTAPSVGIARNVAEPVIEMLFPHGSPCRIPIISITGTNGKTTTTRLIAHIFRQTSMVVGYTTTDGIYIGDCLVEKGDTTGPYSAQVVLRDPTVEIAVLETARGGILRAGLGFDGCDVGIVLNVQADHLGIGDIDTVEDLANLKSVVVAAAFPSGYAVLNADDPLVSAMASKVVAQIAYFSMIPDNPIVLAHTQQGGLAAVYENGYLSIIKGDWTLRIEQAINIPLTMGGRAPFMIQNALAASLAAFAQGVKIEDIRAALASFVSSAQQTPGRMNLFNLGKYHVLIDYAHNPAGYKAISAFINSWTGGEHIGVIGAPGDRRDQDLLELGELAAEMFDWVIIKEDLDRRGREPGVVAHLLNQGLTQINPQMRSQIILDEIEAIEFALDQAKEGALIVILPEKVEPVIQKIEARQPLHLRDAEQNNAESSNLDNLEQRTQPII